MEGPEAAGEEFVENYAQMLGITCTLYDQDILPEDCISSILTCLLPNTNPIFAMKEAFRIFKT